MQSLAIIPKATVWIYSGLYSGVRDYCCRTGWTLGKGEGKVSGEMSTGVSDVTRALDVNSERFEVTL